jgi:hypothetical protein
MPLNAPLPLSNPSFLYLSRYILCHTTSQLYHQLPLLRLRILNHDIFLNLITLQITAFPAEI